MSRAEDNRKAGAAAVAWKARAERAEVVLSSLREENDRLVKERDEARKKAGKLHDYANMRDAQVTDLVASNEALREALEESRSDIHSLCSIGDGLVGWISTAEATENVAKWQTEVIRCTARATNQDADDSVTQYVAASLPKQGEGR